MSKQFINKDKFVVLWFYLTDKSMELQRTVCLSAPMNACFQNITNATYARIVLAQQSLV